MRAIQLIFFIHFLSLSNAFAISTRDSDKFLDQYEGLSHRILGLLNCVSRVMTGDDAIEVPASDTSKKKSVRKSQATTLSGCIEEAGFKTNNKFFQMIAKMGNEEDDIDRELRSIEESLNTKKNSALPAKPISKKGNKPAIGN